MSRKTVFKYASSDGTQTILLHFSGQKPFSSTIADLNFYGQPSF
jgi:hypothetical protein